MEQLFRSVAPHFGANVQLLTPAQRKALVAVARYTTDVVTSSATARELGLPASTLRRSPEALVAKQHIRRVFGGDPALCWTFGDPFFGVWVRRRM